ncbi:MAG: SRPBCC family protein [Actinobacteria bacterium]|nr:SRPBCC family protein [Actinomycetota bacterium]
MQRFEETRHITGMSPDEVFDYITDPANGPELVSAAKQVRAEGEPGEGRVLVTKAGFLGMDFESRSTVTAWDPGRRYAFSGDEPFHLGFDFALSDEDGGTRVDASLETDPGSFFPLGSRMVGKRIGKQFSKDLDKVEKDLST